MNLVEKYGQLRVLLGIVAGLIAMTAISMFIRQCSIPVTYVPDERAGGDTLNVAIELSPMTLSTASDTLSGFGYEMLMQIAGSREIPIKINAFTSLPEALEKLDNGRYDIVISDMPVTASLKDFYGFTIPVYRDRQVLVQLIDSSGCIDVQSQQQLGGKEVWTAAGTPVAARLHTLSREIGDTILVCEDKSHTEEQLLLSVVIGEIPRAAAGQFVAQRMAVDYPQLDTSVDLSFSQLKCWTVRKDNTVLTDSLDKWINAFMSSPAYDSLLKRYDITTTTH